MKKKLGLFAFVLAMAGSWSPMQAQVKLVVHSVDGTLLTTSLDEVKSLVFNESGFSVNPLKGQSLGTFDFSKVSKIEFVSETTGIGDLIANPSRLGLSVSRSSLKVTGWNAGESATVALYSMSGQCCYQDNSWSGEVINISTLPSGVYVLKVNNETFKFSK